jgi:uncharacterized protein (TIGR02246 family)
LELLARLAAIEEIKQLKSRYFRYIDTRNFDGLNEVFARDAVFVQSEDGSAARGRDAVVEWIRGAYASLISVHHGHGHEITLDSETEAHGVIALQDLALGLDGKTKIANGAGHYHETYRFEDGAWRIADVRVSRIYLEWTGPAQA